MYSIPALVVGLASLGAQQGGFEAARVIDGSSYMRVEAVADVDLDGDMDLLSAYNIGSRTYSDWLENDGSGQFTPKQLGDAVIFPQNLGYQAQDAFMGVTSPGPLGSQTIVTVVHDHIWTQIIHPVWGPQANQEFHGPEYGVVGDAWTSAALADFNADGVDDLFVAYDGDGGSSMRVFLGVLGQGGPFTKDSPLVSTAAPILHLNALTPQPGGPAAVGVQGSEVVCFEWSNGAPVVSQAFDVNASAALMIAVGDIDGDSDEDIVAFEENQQYTVLRRSGPNAFTMEAKLLGGPATHLADVDADGDLDGVCCGGGGGSSGGPPSNTIASTFRVSLNDGAGNFDPSYEIPGIGANNLAGVADIDGNGHVDLIAGRAIFFASESLSSAPITSTGTDAIEPRAAFDFDRDADLDQSVGLDSVVLGLGDGTFLGGSTWVDAAPEVSWDGPGIPGDFDGDGDIDLLAHTYVSGSSDGMHLFANNGGGGFVDNGQVHPSLIDVAGNMADTAEEALAADADGDGDLDLFVHSLSGARHTRLFLNEGSGQLTQGPDFLDEIVRHVVDVNGDEIPDLVSSTDNVGFRIGQGGLVWGARSTFYQSQVDAYTDRYVAADVDGDGDVDFAIRRRVTQFDYDEATLHFYENLGGGAFSTDRLTSYSHENDHIARRLTLAADVNGDGCLDLLSYPAVHGGPAIEVFLCGGGSFGDLYGDSTLWAVFGEEHITQSTGSIVATDIDSDGDVDLLTDRVFENTAFHGPSAGARRQYGTGVGGDGGMIPNFGAKGPFRLGSQAQLFVTGGAGGSLATITWGLAESNTVDFPIPGLVSYNFPWLHKNRIPFQLSGLPGEVGTGELTINLNVTPQLSGLTLYNQLYLKDPGAPVGWSASGGLQIDFY